VTSTSAIAGHHAGTLTLSFCSDAQCSDSASTLTSTIPYAIDVLNADSAWTGDHLTTLEAWPEAMNWNTFQGNAAHNGHVDATIDPQHIISRWRIPSGTLGGLGGTRYDLPNTLTTANGAIYHVDGMQVVARNESDASELWRYDFSSLSFPSVNPPAVGYGLVFVAAGQQDSTYFFALNANDGSVAFKSTMSSQWEHYLAPTIGEHGVYTNAGSYGGLYAFDNTGGRLFFGNEAQTSEWTPAVDAQSVYSYTGGNLTVRDALTGSVTQQIADPTFDNFVYEIGGSPVLGAPGKVFAANYMNSKLDDGAIGNTLLCFDTDLGTIAWQFAGDYPSTPAYADGVVYAANEAPVRLEARGEQDGSLLWSWTPPRAGEGHFISETLLTDNLAFVSTEFATYAIDLNSHKTVWSYPYSGRLALSRNGVLFIQGTDYITALNVK
jgi:hypothetical protein